jgi:type VI secretion system protein VasJ
MSELLDDISRPISDDAPSGEDIARLEPSTDNEEWIQTYAELRALTNKAASNCDSIVALSQNILANKSKDLRVAGYLVSGLVHQQGFSGLAEGMKAYQILIQDYWDNGLYPSRDAARGGNINTLDKRLGQDISAQTGDKEYFIPTKPTDAEALEEIKTTIDEINANLAEKSAGRPISLENLGRAIAGRLKEVEATAKKSTPASAAAKPTERRGVGGLLRRKPPTPTAAPEQAEVAPEAAEAAVAATINNEIEAAKAVIRAANFLLRKDPTSATPYRLLRSSLWYMLPLPNPEPNRSGKKVTQYNAPVGKARLEELLRDEEWESLVIECETVFTERFDSAGGGCFCLDIQRFLSIALKELSSKADEGGDTRKKAAYDAVNKLILQETAFLVERYPWISEIYYSNETPFVDGQTKNWIEKTVKPVLKTAAGPQQGVPTGGGSADGDPKISEDYEKAMDLVAKEKLVEAVDLLQTGINTEASRKGLFQRRLNLASLCMDAAQPGMARPVLEQLDEEIDRLSLDQWEPSLCVQVWYQLKRCYQDLMSKQEAQGSDGVYREKADKVFEKICRLDIRAALTPDAK